jgi:archaellum component FlaC
MVSDSIYHIVGQCWKNHSYNIHKKEVLVKRIQYLIERLSINLTTVKEDDSEEIDALVQSLNRLLEAEKKALERYKYAVKEGQVEAPSLRDEIRGKSSDGKAPQV